jgi:16S rRNA (uracil1498-N3)-methyltransferase
VKITLAQALPKKQKFDTVIEKATELGVEKIIPLITERTIVRLNAADYKQKKSRWEAIAISAAKQSGRTKIPVVAAPQAFLDFLPCLKNFDLGLIFCLEPQAQPLKEILRQKAKQKNVLALIGPEGDFSPQETEQALNYGAIAASLGRLVLKTDTASIAVLSILTYAYGS